MFDVTAFLSGLATADGLPDGDLCKPVNGVELTADGLRWPVGDAARPDGPEGGPERLAGCGAALADGLQERGSSDLELPALDGLPVKLDLDDIDRLAVAVAMGGVPRGGSADDLTVYRACCIIEA
jgi:hypothetical protein